MKFTSTTLAVASLLAAANAQNMTSNSTTGGSSNYTTGLLAALQGAGLTTLAGILQGYPQLAQALQAANYTVFAPSNSALSSLMSSGASLNNSQIQDVLSYHITPAHIATSNLTVGTTHTIVPSLLQEPLLGSNTTAPLVLSIGADGRARVRTAAQNVTVGANTTYENLLVQVVNEVITPPQNLTATIALAGLQGLSGALSAVSSVLPVTALEMTPRITVFAPIDTAFANISSTISQLNASTIATVLANHVINGTVVYSTGIQNGTTAVSAAGETFTFTTENGTVYVSSGPARARVVRTDIPVANGVMHLIDAVLANPASNPQAASSAASSAAAAATGATGLGAAGATDKGAGFKAMVGVSTLAAAVVGAAVAVIA